MKSLLQILLFGLITITTTTSAQRQGCRGGRTVQWGGKNYFFSWENSHTQSLMVGGDEAQNICRQHCMNLVSLESPQENNFVKQRMANARIRYIWTSGRKNGNLINGWFWSGSGVRIAPTNQRRNGDWSHTGGAGVQQPDNRENDRNLVGYMGNEELCLAILNNFYNDGLKWHDVACYHKKPFVCEN